MNTPEFRPESRPATEQGWLSELGWLGAGLALPCVSPRFYRLAVRRKVILAVLFFVIFELVITLLMTASVGRALFSVTKEVRKAFDSGQVPEIIIQDGLAWVDAKQPYVLYEDEETIVILDTTGAITELDRSRYNQGFLLTRTSLHVMNNTGRYQELPLSSLHELLGADPILINAEWASRYWMGLSAITSALALVGLALWNTLARFMGLATLGVVIWGVASLLRPRVGFGLVLIIGLYALVPATYLHYLLGLAGVKFFGLHSLLLLVIWAMALWAALTRPEEIGIDLDLPKRSVQILAALPMLLVLALNAVFAWPKGVWVAWPVALVTLAALAALEVWIARRAQPVETKPIG